MPGGPLAKSAKARGVIDTIVGVLVCCYPHAHAPECGEAAKAVRARRCEKDESVFGVSGQSGTGAALETRMIVLRSKVGFSPDLSESRTDYY